ncbi:PKD domain-containing protein [Hanamia caeni]|uniref:PKD domain-containing protein n=1 Tax=Hanamia caeni TaxID=2294116 RepID=A0A3M9NHF8_9BACT|nr:PKD domain-containing protein [Hanamia caeni]RNI36643.1 PKD domain-containing protein [Hanamia caeni]
MKTLTFCNYLIKAKKHLSLFAVFFLSGFLVKAQLKANFEATPTSGCAPLVVQFSDSSSGNPSQWKWDLGNGTSSVLQNPSVAYFSPGTYTISLVIKNAYGIDSVTKVQYITVYSAPEINFNASKITGCFPLTTNFFDSSVAGDGTLSTWQWDFGDGNFSDIQNPQHVYTSEGNFNVSLKATNIYGCVTSKTIKNYIAINTGVKADFSNLASKTCNAPATISFVNKSSGVGNLSYTWDFGDSASSSLENPKHTFTNSGSYSVSLIVNNEAGCSDTLLKPKLINVGSTVADFDIPAVVCAETPVLLQNTSKPTPSGASWNFGDGTFSDSVNAVKIFKLPGEYSVKMKSNNGACMDSITKLVTVLPKPVVNFTTADTISCGAPFTVNFQDKSSGSSNSSRSRIAGQSYQWDFGDGSISNEQNPTHTYTKEGSYTVKLFVTNAAGCTDSLVKKAFVKIKAPVAVLNGLPKSGCAPLTHQFSSSINSLEKISKYHWDFGDGTFSDSITPTHTYTSPGFYTITLTYTTVGGCTDSVVKTNGIVIGQKPKATYIADPLETCAFKPVNFKDNSEGNPDQWVWFFGDGSSATTQNPSHLYNDTGFFSVTLIAINNGCADTLTNKSQVHINPPVARFTYQATCSTPRQVIFKDQSVGADYWLWNFGDGTTSTEQNPSHVYNNPGLYEVTLTVTNQASGCSESKTISVKIIREIADFTLSNAETCRNAPVTFNAANINPANINLYTWKFGDGATISGTSSSVVHNYKNASSYNVSLIIRDVNGCIDSITKPTAVTVNGPTAVFRSTVDGTCINSTVNFLDSSYSDGNHPIQQYKWNWGDGKTEELSSGSFNHAYTTSGNYTVSLVVTDTKGCSDTLKKVSAVVISNPVAAFKADTLSCTSKAINFTDSSSGPSLTYTWDFGDGTTSNQKSPVHLYPVEGFYNVSLSIVDKYGCSSSVSKPSYVHIGNPVADFTVSDTIGTCPPLIVNFTNTSVNYSKWRWDFGDGTSSNERNPSHFYSTAGTFYAVLTIYGATGCESSKTQKIVVKGPSGALSYTTVSGCAPLKATFQAHTKKNISFVWDFNDGTTITTNDSNVVHTYTSPGKYLPKIILQDASGCKVAVKGKDSISVYGITASFDHNGRLVCDSGEVSFANTSLTNDVVSSYYWNFGDGTTSSSAFPKHVYTTPGSYKASLKVVTKNGCVDSVQNPAKIIVNPSPKLAIKGTAGACVPATISFTGAVSNPDTSVVSWKWDLANGNVSTLQNPVAQTYATSGNYTVKAIGLSTNGCSDTVTRQVEVYPLPKLSIAADTVVCYGSYQTLTVSGAETYSWSSSKYLSCTNCAAPVARPDSAITYHVKGTSSKGCVSFDSISISVKYPFKLSVSKADTLCIGKSVKLTASGSEKYSWYPAAGLSSVSIASPVASPDSSTTYQVVGSDSKGCFTDTAYIPVKVYPIPQVDAGADQSINVGRSIKITPTLSADVTRFEWSPTIGIVSQENPDITVKPTQSVEYTLRVKNAGGCIAEDKVSVYVLCDNSNIFVPNTFSPNGDGNNDVFFPRGSGVFKIQNIKVFNRWGEVVFEKSNFNANDAAAGWNGTFKGKPLAADVFVYIMQVICDNNSTLTFRGNITLLR